MDLENLLKANQYLNHIYIGLGTAHTFKNDLTEFNYAYLAGYRGAMIALFDGYCDLLIDLENESKNDG